MLVAYHICAGPNGTVPQIQGVPRRCEFGQEICITLAHQHDIIGLPLDKAIAEIEFFWGLKLRKSQSDAMLNRRLVLIDLATRFMTARRIAFVTTVLLRMTLKKTSINCLMKFFARSARTNC